MNSLADKVNECLAANAWKHGAVKRALEECGAPGETFDLLFETTYDEELKVIELDTRFVK